MSFPIIHSTGSVPDQGSMIFPQVAAAARDAGQPTETRLITQPTSVLVEMQTLPAQMQGLLPKPVDIGALTIQHNVQANNVDAPGNIVSTVRFENTIIPPIGEAIDTAAHHTAAHDPIRNARVSFVEDLEEELPPAYEEHALLTLADCHLEPPSKTILEKLPILIAALGHPPRAFVVHPTDLLQWLVTVLKRLTVVHSRLRPPGPTCLVPPLVLVLHPVHYPRSQPLPE
ncbi:hypothetical protein H4Q26_009944 [Puccinia striiformis f. sp. tritici PST-130]|nr:hypothetical protein H4Q26_009944 [Puccinia striiformis f. sp. tritici PST-130]